ncbi:MAG: hypothetical protein ACR2RF_01035 [Geminicoccaceae bacterium]
MIADHLLRLGWFFAVLLFMAWTARPIDQWTAWSYGSALGFVCVVGLWGPPIGRFMIVLIREFWSALADGYRKVTEGRELDEAELE